MTKAESSKAAANFGIKPNSNGSAAAHDLPWYASSVNTDCPRANISYAGSKNIDPITSTT